jgi:DNA processing protein
MKIGVVGSRMMSAYGKRVISSIVPELVRQNQTIVTGGTLGCNAWVTLLCQKMGARVEIVKIGPRIRDFETMNLELAKIVDKLLVVEGGENSGTILVAKATMDLGKEVWAIPGRIDDKNSVATNFLIANGARLFGSIEDML